jgi:hypothetical protein
VRQFFGLKKFDSDLNSAVFFLSFVKTLENIFMRCLSAIALLLLTFASEAQLKGLGSKLLKGTDPLQIQKAPITTSLDDAKWGAENLDNFTPREPLRSLMTLQRTTNGGFILQPGYYKMQTQSYCLKAGTHGPGEGEGYLYAPPLGPMDDIVIAIVRNSVNHPSIDQHDIQLLLWAIIARAKYENLDNNIKLIASQLLSPAQLATINRTGLDAVPESLRRKAINAAPAPLRAALEAEAQLRNMFYAGTSSYNEMERVAVLAGVAPMGEGSLNIPKGRWSLHPDGYYVRYIPTGYSSTAVEIWLPQGSPAVGKEYDPATHIAVPGNTARQRLIQSGRQRSEN